MKIMKRNYKIDYDASDKTWYSTWFDDTDRVVHRVGRWTTRLDAQISCRQKFQILTQKLNAYLEQPN